MLTAFPRERLIASLLLFTTLVVMNSE